MNAKSFIALDSHQCLTSGTTAQTFPYDHYCCHLCGSELTFHPEWKTNQPWFEHTREGMTENGRQHCPYVNIAPVEQRLVQQLRRFLPDACPVVHKADWHCSSCNSDYHGERYCRTCQTGKHSTHVAE